MTRAGVKTIAVAAASLALVIAAGFAVQAAALGRPGRDPILAIRSVGKLVAYRTSHASVTIDGKHLETACVQVWVGVHRDAAVKIAGGPTLLEIGTNLVQTGKLADAEFRLAGCPRPLAKWIATELNRGSALEVKPTRFDGEPVYLIGFPTLQPRLSLYVSRRGGLPLALRFSGNGIEGSSRVRYGIVSAKKAA